MGKSIKIGSIEVQPSDALVSGIAVRPMPSPGSNQMTVPQANMD